MFRITAAFALDSLSPEKLNTKDKFDIILNMEIVEHVDDVNLFIKNCTKFLKKDRKI